MERGQREKGPKVTDTSDTNLTIIRSINNERIETDDEKASFIYGK